MLVDLVMLPPHYATYGIGIDVGVIIAIGAGIDVAIVE